MVHCVKLGREAEGLEKPPLKTELGQKIFENVSKGECAARLPGDGGELPVGEVVRAGSRESAGRGAGLRGAQAGTAALK